MDPEVVIIADDGTEHVFPPGFDPQQAASIVRGGGQGTEPAPSPVPQEASSMGMPVSGGAGLALAGMKAAPGIVSMVNKGAKLGASAMQSAPMKYGVGALALGDIAGDAARGDMAGAAKTAGGYAGMKLLEKGVSALQRASAPAKGFRRTPGILARGAGAVSRTAGRLAGPVALGTTLLDLQNFALAAANDPNTDPREREAILGMLGGSPLSGIISGK